MEEITDFLKTWWPPVSAITTLIFSWALHAMRKEFPTKEELQSTIKPISEKLADVDTEVVRLQETVKHLPDQSDLKNLRHDMAQQMALMQGVSKQVEGVAESVRGLNVTVNMLVKNELKQ